ncbi:2-oxo acid dehydrogenase subunit E2 [Candidatus Bathyarchaeota archaeon]|nr:2-oxo acid dehydrogenase subunit E2 [Candidatus Bathyarchaeota archaeon]
MVTKVVMPKLSLTMKEGTVGKWYKQEGETVEKDEPIVEVISEKATYDLEAPATGILRKILIEEGVDAPVNAVLAVITAPDEPFSETEIITEAPPSFEEKEKRILASPAAKRLAKEHGVDLSLVKGSGPEGRVVEEDIKKFIEETSVLTPKVKEIIQLSGFRKISAERVSTSFKTAPHSTLMMTVDVSNATKLHEALQVSYTAIIVRATAKALRGHPIINSTMEGDRIKIYEDVNVGLAVATENGLVVPVIRNADKKPLKEIDTTIRELTEKARQGKLAKEDITGGTFTISNLGMYDVESFTPIINPPEAAILGIGKITEKPIIINGNVVAKPMMTLSLSYDHRIVDGAPAADFLRNIKQRIEQARELENES